MSLISGIFNSTAVETTESGLLRGNKAVDASFLAKLFSTFFKTGVAAGASDDGFRTAAAGGAEGSSTAMQVVTAPGACIIDGYFAYDTAKETRTFSTSTADRCAVKLFRLDLSDGSIKTTWKECTRSGSLLITKAEGQALPVRTGEIYDLVTAVVDIPAGAAAITADMVTDLRGDVAYCGFAAVNL